MVLFPLYLSSLISLTGSFRAVRTIPRQLTPDLIVQPGDLDDWTNPYEYDDNDYYYILENYNTLIDSPDLRDAFNTRLCFKSRDALHTGPTSSGPMIGNQYGFGMSFGVDESLRDYLQNIPDGASFTLFNFGVYNTSRNNNIKIESTTFCPFLVNLGFSITTYFEFYDSNGALFEHATYTFAFNLWEEEHLSVQNIYLIDDAIADADSAYVTTTVSYSAVNFQTLEDIAQDAVDNAYVDGYNSGYGTGYTNGYNIGKNDGYALGSSSNSIIRNLLGSIIDTPIIYLRKLFGYELFGINLFGALTTVISLIVALSVFKLVKGIF